MTQPLSIVVGTRGSALALKQTQIFLRTLKAVHPQLNFEIKNITTSGDRIQDRFLSAAGGKGLFVKEIEEALLAGEIDLAVHSLKDFPAKISEELDIGCFPERKSPFDVLVSPGRNSLTELKSNAVIGTSSLRRRSQIKNLHPDFEFELLRGNIDTRLKKLTAGRYDAIVLAKAGMERLGLDLENAVELPIVPAPGQGTLAIEIRQRDDSLRKLLEPLYHLPTKLEAEAERYVMEALGGDCNLPLGALGRASGGKFSLKTFVGLPDGSKVVEVEKEGALQAHQEIAGQVVEEMLSKGAVEIIEACRL